MVLYTLSRPDWTKASWSHDNVQKRHVCCSICSVESYRAGAAAAVSSRARGTLGGDANGLIVVYESDEKRNHRGSICIFL